MYVLQPISILKLEFCFQWKKKTDKIMSKILKY